ncbi:MAG TPA: hypothetical protein DEH07_06595, partial [Desulfotomaculum sp.]|nr:hypothetical protein [Desulfotomaculum sp.]
MAKNVFKMENKVIKNHCGNIETHKKIRRQSMTFNEMTKTEPRLKQLYNKARMVDGSGKHFCANYTWYELFKPQLLD